MMLFFKKRSIKRIGAIVLGFGILFVGLDLMSGAMAPLKEMQSFQNFLISFKNPVIGILIGILVTAIIQSSSASIGILAGLAIAGAIDLPLAVYVILGANVGTCITALIACIGSSKTAKQTAVIFLIYNVIKVTMFAIIIQFVPIVDWLVASGMGVRTQIAVFHTAINVFALLVLIWTPQFMIKLAKLIVRGEDDTQEQKRFKYIGAKMLDTPSIAVGQSLREVGRMAEMAKENYEQSMQSLLELDETKATKVLEQEQVVNFLNHEITDYLARLSALELATKDALIVADLFHIVNDIERISDHAENIAEYTMMRIDEKVPFTKDAVAEISEMNGYVLQALEDCVLAFENNDDELAQEVIRIEKIVDDFEEQLKQSHVKRIAKGKCTARASMIFSDLITNLERVSDHATNIAYYVLKSDYR